MRRLITLSIALVILLAGCGRKNGSNDQSLRLEELSDTTGLTRGEPLVRAFEPYRVANGVLRVRGTADFPDDTRLQVSILERASGHMVQRFQVEVHNHRFDSPPLVGATGPLPVADYRFEVLTHFNDVWQPPNVLSETNDGHSLRGPGITRGTQGEAVFHLVEELRI